jgi:phosphatidylserine decarboxylase
MVTFLFSTEAVTVGVVRATGSVVGSISLSHEPTTAITIIAQMVRKGKNFIL